MLASCCASSKQRILLLTSEPVDRPTSAMHGPRFGMQAEVLKSMRVEHSLQQQAKLQRATWWTSSAAVAAERAWALATVLARTPCRKMAACTGRTVSTFPRPIQYEMRVSRIAMQKLVPNIMRSFQ